MRKIAVQSLDLKQPPNGTALAGPGAPRGCECLTTAHCEVAGQIGMCHEGWAKRGMIWPAAGTCADPQKAAQHLIQRALELKGKSAKKPGGG